MQTKAIPTGDESLLHDLCHDTVGCMSRLYRHHGDIVAFPKGTDQTVFAFSPEANRDVFTDTRTFHAYETARAEKLRSAPLPPRHV